MNTRRSAAPAWRLPTTGVSAGQRGGGCEIGTRVGLPSILRRSSHRRLGHAATGSCRGPVARPARTGHRPRRGLDATERLPYYGNRSVATCWRTSWHFLITSEELWRSLTRRPRYGRRSPRPRAWCLVR